MRLTDALALGVSTGQRTSRPGRRLTPRLPSSLLAVGSTLAYLGVMVLLPCAALTAAAASSTWTAFWHCVSSPRVLASYELSFGAALAAALVNVIMGPLVAWVLVRYRFPGRQLLDALIDLPFALPTAVAGIALTSLHAPHGWLGGLLPWRIAFTPVGVVVALIFIGLPFVVRTVQPVLEELSSKAGTEIEEAAACLGATRLAVIRRIILPEVMPAVVTGFALAFARGVGEYGSVVFIAGNIPMHSEIAPLLILTRLEEFDDAGATAIAVVMLAVSFTCLVAINLLQRWMERRSHAA